MEAWRNSYRIMVMDKCKIENYQRTNPGMPFPVWESLLPARCSLFKSRIVVLLGLEPTVDSLVLVNRLNEVASDVGNCGSDPNRLDLLKVFQSQNIDPLGQVYVNWYRFDDIDKIALADLQLHIGDIWYPASDDIDIFDDTLKWISSVTHYGAIRVLKL